MTLVAFVPEEGLGLEQGRRAHSRRELIVDGAVHVFGLAFGIGGAALLLTATAGQSDAFKLISVLVYALGLIAMLGASAAYNIGYHTGWRSFFRRCDHCAIFLMIAGTYTPFILHHFGGLVATALASVVWFASLFGIGLKLSSPRLFEKLSVGLYLLLGWFSVMVFAPIFGSMDATTVAMLVAGGMLYTGGVVFHLWEKLPFQNAIWHVFVLGAAVCHYNAVLGGVVYAGA